VVNESRRERRGGDVLVSEMTRVASRIYIHSAGTRPAHDVDPVVGKGHLQGRAEGKSGGRERRASDVGSRVSLIGPMRARKQEPRSAASAPYVPAAWKIPTFVGI
jgi:hypothetical protein